MARSSSKDLTAGKPLPLILGFMIPLICGLLFQQFYNMVDTFVVGRFLGVDALAGVGSTSSVNFLILGFCNGICAGFAIPVAQKFGQKDFENLRRYVANIIWLGVIIAAIITLLTGIFCKQILLLMNTKEEFFDEAYSYISIIFYGIPTTMLYNMLAGIIRSMGDSKTPLYFLLTSSVLNIALDLVTVLIFQMGVEGPALATVVSQAVSGFLCLFYMARKFDVLKMQKGEMRPSRHHIKRLCGVGIPMGLQYSVTAIGSIILQTAINSFGTAYVAAVTASNKVNHLLYVPMDALGSTAATYAGQNLGAARFDRIRHGVRVFLLIGAAFAALSFVVLFFFGGSLASLFIDSADAAIRDEVITHATSYLRIASYFHILIAILHTYRFTVQGLGFSKIAIFAGLFEMAARILVAVVLTPAFGFIAICFASAIAWLFADAFLLPCYYYIMHRLERPYKT